MAIKRYSIELIREEATIENMMHDNDVWDDDMDLYLNILDLISRFESCQDAAQERGTYDWETN